MLFFLCLCLSVSLSSCGHYTNEWAVQIKGGAEKAQEVAQHLNCKLEGKTRKTKYSASKLILDLTWVKSFVLNGG